MSGNKEPADLVMLVDDSADELAMMVEVMRSAGLATVTAVSGEAALSLLQQVLPQLVVMDAMMPGLDGFETCRRIKGQARLAHLPVIFMTGLKEPENVLKGLDAGGVDYVAKPVNLQELLARVRIHIANGRVAFSARVALDITGRYLFATDAQGLARWSTPQASSLMAAWFGVHDEDVRRLPHAITQLVLAMIQDGEINLSREVISDSAADAAITYLGPNGADEHLFRLSGRLGGADENTLRDKLGLTQREAEVLVWIARAKSNREISDILSISPRTVNKHLERIFTKLGIENRAAATSVAMRTLAAHI